MSIPSRNPAPTGAPKDAAEAEARFWRRYGWRLVRALLPDARTAPPTTVAEWIQVAERVRDALNRPSFARLADMLERACFELRGAQHEGDDA